MKQITVILLALVLIAGAFALTLGPFTAEEAEEAFGDPVFYNELGFHLKELGNPQGAMNAFAKSVELDPSYEMGRKNLALTAFENGEYILAADNWRVLLENRNKREYHFDLAQSLVAQARFAETDGNAALAQLEEALEHLEAAGDWPHARENAQIVRNVLSSI